MNSITPEAVNTVRRLRTSQHQVIIVLNDISAHDFAIARIHVDRADTHAAAALQPVLRNRRAFAIAAFSHSQQHTAHIVDDFHADQPVAFAQFHAANAHRCTRHRAQNL